MRCTLAKVEVTNRVWTLDELRRVHNRDILTAETGGNLIPANSKDFLFREHLTVHMGTTQPKKIDEFEAPLAHQVKDVRLASAVGSLGWWLCDPEESGTYIGNAAGKALALIDRIYSHGKQGYSGFASNLRKQGINPDNFMLVVNDTGYSFERDYSHEPEFEKSLHKTGPVSWPGPELGPVMDAHTGVGGFYTDLKRMAQRLEAQGEKVDLNGYDEVTYMFFRPRPNIEDVRVYSFSSKVPVKFLLDPQEYNGEVLTSLHFMKLRADSVPENLRDKTIANIKKEYLDYHSPMAHALGEFFKKVNVPITMQHNFMHAAKPQPSHFQIATQENLIPASHRIDPDANFLLPDHVSASKVRYDHDQKDSLHYLTRSVDAVVLQNHSRETLNNWNDRFLSMMDMWCSLLVKKQVNVETMHAKPLLVLQRPDNKFYHDGFTNGDLNWDDPKTERAFLKYLDGIDPAKDPWLKMMMMTRYLHEKNFVKQEEHHLFTQVDPDNQDVGAILQSKIAESLSQTLDVPNYKRESYGYDQKGMFEVFIAGSAGTHAQAYTDAAEELGYWCASQGFHVRTGGGNFGVMGAAARGVLRFMDEHPERANETHLSLIQTFRTIQYEGAAIDPKEIERRPNIHMAIEPTFDTRMANLFRVRDGDAENPNIGTANIVMAAGIGTVQEATRWMRIKETGVPHMQNQKMIFFNQNQANDETGRQIGVLDAIIRTYTPEIRKKHIDVRPDLESVKNAIMERHQKWAQEPAPLRVTYSGQTPGLGLN